MVSWKMVFDKKKIKEKKSNLLSSAPGQEIELFKLLISLLRIKKIIITLEKNNRILFEKVPLS